MQEGKNNGRVPNKSWCLAQNSHVLASGNRDRNTLESSTILLFDFALSVIRSFDCNVFACLFSYVERNWCYVVENSTLH